MEFGNLLERQGWSSLWKVGTVFLTHLAEIVVSFLTKFGHIGILN